ncbi:peptidoglycan-associated lipoprotein Pal [Geotalea uraniireducens]|uniref:Peptidoglycan-associated lipoprotein n=1 Tax=Geotalea uraniireducens (strain Rf4) TaxID=351605 RepID=A5GDB9_GEOUR|nr:peptidoglycan-associated lipoprotein Pal [Geotalea uraniireducens]ABQ24418.1 OmpA/MotB domain protein [Geotalea uraniireducens Rf4]
MRKGMVGLVTVLFCGALLVGGCAKKEMVKGEEGVVPSAATEKPAVTPPAKPSMTEEVVKEQPIKEATTIAEASIKEQPVTAVAATELGKVYFDFDSFVLTQTSRDILSNNAKWLLKTGRAKVQIEGHCDERGSDEYNLALGEKRAKSAMNYLVTLGVPADQLSVISYGKEKPADPGHNEAAWAKNRRAEFVIIK